MKNKTTFRMSLIVSAFMLLTLPSMINANSAGSAVTLAQSDCEGDYVACMNGGGAECLEQYLDCTGE